MKLTQEEFFNVCLKLNIIESYHLENKIYDVYNSWNAGNIDQESGYYGTTYFKFNEVEPEPIFKEFNLILEYFFPNISIWTYFKLNNNLIKRPISKNYTCSMHFNLIDIFNYFNANYAEILENKIGYEN